MNQTIPDLSIDETLEILADPRRRATLRYLKDSDAEVVDLERLVESVATELGTRPGDGPGAGRLRVSLRHVHLPKLASAGLVDYDSVEGTLRYQQDEGIESLLHFVGENLPQHRQA